MHYGIFMEINDEYTNRCIEHLFEKIALLLIRNTCYAYISLQLLVLFSRIVVPKENESTFHASMAQPSFLLRMLKAISI